MADGRFAPSPTGPLHVGNLRTALLSWLYARVDGGRFLVRIEDLDPVASREELVEEHLGDLAALGLDHDGPVLRQSDPATRGRHEAAIAQLEADGALYPCFCSRREIREASQAAHGPLPEGAYPGTCRDLGDAERAERAAARPGRPPSLRVRADDARVTIRDRLHGERTGVVDDFVVRRGDGVPAYNLAVVVDDAHQDIAEVVRGDDLLEGTPRQAWLCDRLGLPRPRWVHVPLVVGPDGERLAKRHGSVTRSELAVHGIDATGLLGRMGASLGLASHGERVDATTLLTRFDPDAVPLERWVFDAPI
ncbi:MAG TPA: tRNA glutamyl-Q(34) synthetase GluQRS [Acidimicrobiales bacterium]|nr:tRNA glutamyl-Q(34) synthetase GluQRS [Acidimicrobiales bacterium]